MNTYYSFIFIPPTQSYLVELLYEFIELLEMDFVDYLSMNNYTVELKIESPTGKIFTENLMFKYNSDETVYDFKENIKTVILYQIPSVLN
jgi:hypothetical protein